MSKEFLIIGSYPYKNRPNSIGGATNLVKSLLEYLKKHNIEYYYISSNPFGFNFSYILNYLIILFKAIFLVPLSKNVMINCSKNGALYLFPLIFIISKIFNKKIIFRMFGGNFINIYQDSNYIIKKILYNSLKYSDIIFFETKYIIKSLENIFPNNTNVMWFPNTRFKKQFEYQRKYKKRYVFISHLRYSKGIDNIIEAASLLSENYSIDFYGPVIEQKYNAEFINAQKNCNYKGVLEIDNVIDKLNLYDVVLLPSHKEGYPGIIIEAYSLGIPVIASNLEGISEIVENKKSGILIPPKNTNALYNAIKSINEDNYISYSKNAEFSFENFNSKIIYPEILKSIRNLREGINIY